ncbi:MAG: YabP/YqfC family sporulation protein [Oscillospiraceae bacterium]|jgi:sporulation protein YqfC
MENVSLSERAAEKFGLPADVVANTIRLVLTGSRQLYIENHRGVLGLDEYSITVAGGRVNVRIFGSGLRLRAMNRHEMFVTGEFKTIEYI